MSKINKSNLLIDNKREAVFFIYNARVISFNCQSLVENFFRMDFCRILVNEYVKHTKDELDFDIIETIKNNIFTSVYKAKLKSNKEIVAVKKNNKR